MRFVQMWWVGPGWTPGAHHSHSITPLPRWTGERKYNKRLMCRDKGRDHSAITNTGKIDLTWGNQFNLSPVKSE